MKVIFDLPDVSRNQPYRLLFHGVIQTNLPLTLIKLNIFYLKTGVKTLRVSGQVLVNGTILESVEFNISSIGICIDKRLDMEKNTLIMYAICLVKKSECYTG